MHGQGRTYPFAISVRLYENILGLDALELNV